MSDMYAMRRANGDWFAIENRGLMRVPLFRNSHDALMARFRNFGMLLFKPVPLNAQLLREMVPAGSGSYVDFCIVDDPFASLERGSPMKHAALAFQMLSSNEPPVLGRNGKCPQVSIAIKACAQSEWWN